MQAPVPYLNRALAEEQLGVDADEHNEHQEAQVQYSGAVKVGLYCLCINAVAHEYIDHLGLGILLTNCRVYKPALCAKCNVYNLRCNNMSVSKPCAQSSL